MVWARTEVPIVGLVDLSSPTEFSSNHCFLQSILSKTFCDGWSTDSIVVSLGLPISFCVMSRDLTARGKSVNIFTDRKNKSLKMNMKTIKYQKTLIKKSNRISRRIFLQKWIKNLRSYNYRNRLFLKSGTFWSPLRVKECQIKKNHLNLRCLR